VERALRPGFVATINLFRVLAVPARGNVINTRDVQFHFDPTTSADEAIDLPYLGLAPENSNFAFLPPRLQNVTQRRGSGPRTTFDTFAEPSKPVRRREGLGRALVENSSVEHQKSTPSNLGFVISDTLIAN
jgi:hypothetical protein